METDLLKVGESDISGEGKGNGSEEKGNLLTMERK